MYYSVSPPAEDTYNATDRRFALCESCFWSATILKPKDNDICRSETCPACSIGYVSIIPLGYDEAYELEVRPKGGLEVRFSKASL